MSRQRLREEGKDPPGPLGPRKPTRLSRRHARVPEEDDLLSLYTCGEDTVQIVQTRHKYLLFTKLSESKTLHPPFFSNFRPFL